MKINEFLNEEGYRLDGRKTNECRFTKIHLEDDNTLNEKDGFAFFEIGNTKILAHLQGPVELKKINDECTIRCEVFLSPFSSYENRKHKSHDSITNELSTYICNICENIILLDLYKNSEICIYLYIIERDGGVKHAAINTCLLTLVDAGIAVKYFITACSALYWQNKVLIDPNQLEINSGAPELTVVIDVTSEKIILLEFDAEISIEDFKFLLHECIKACVKLGNIMRLAIKENAVKILSLNDFLSLHH